MGIKYMKIISLKLNIDLTQKEMADTFILNAKPFKNGEIIENAFIVSAIKFFETSTTYAKFYRGPLFIIEFKDSTIRKIIPAHCVVSVDIETAEKNQAKVDKDLPKLSEEN